ncbi:decaprenylphospho-beta-D-erythro-pentofuranosid-2-ulose 2-reductase [Actinomycetospora termitidis]|uniref:Decaprenylphospho-beta-D-erythro-pentofuranosid-2-ulose 2-reductase n=1 Tax=Actinomycetospora termitidis TaxID=3053470 RepID=A0ABT7M1V6_9PSEU|nr:decaprenylphospho-beta-D-erythro-pentofuranosid-2-ulose 2-reductase [Actinomycetospora sp. Odt1-22]MDL5154642.1 decaprenylphospho-beta-D-erythro-pentofuranosid-2-ulose 2-reductase [Actinomycetospora sp. Odt1-22]
MIDAVGHPSSLLLLGGTSEIGLAIAERYLEGGPVRVVLAGRQSPRLADAAARLDRAGATTETVEFDAKDAAVHTEAVRKAFAGGDIDVAVVAFGLLGDQEKAWQDIDVAVELAEVNYVATVSVGVALATEFRRQGHGRIVALSSVAGERARRSNFVYGSTKAGMDAFYTGLTEALRGDGIGVTIVRPGFVHSKMTEGMDAAPLATTPEKVAEVAVDAVTKGRELVWAPAPLRAVMSVLRHIPRPIFRRLPV